MADIGAMKEFLVALGFKTDEAGLRRFEHGILAATVKVSEFGAAMATAALAVEKGVERVASKFEDMYYASERAQSIVGNLRGIAAGVGPLRAVEEAGQRIGLGIGGATAAVQGLASAMRLNPQGVGGYIRGQLRVATAGRETADVLVDIVDKLRLISRTPQGYAIAARIGRDILGISPEALMFMIDHYREFRKEIQEAREAQKRSGIEQGPAAVAFRNFMNVLRDVGREWGNLADKLAIHLLPIAEKVLLWSKNLAMALLRLDQATGGWSTTIGGTVLAIGGLVAALRLLLGVLGFLGIGAGAKSLAGKGALALLLRRLLLPLGIAVAVGAALGDGGDDPLGEAAAGMTKGRRPGETFSQAVTRRLKEWFKRVWSGEAQASTGAGEPAGTAVRDAAPEERRLLRTLGAGEAKGYGERYGGAGGTQHFTDFSQHPNIAVPIPGKPGQTSNAAGYYQFLFSTWETYRKKLNLPDFSPESQDRAALEYARDLYRQMFGGDILEALRGGKLAQVERALKGAWPGGGADFARRYAGLGGMGRQAAGAAGQPGASAARGQENKQAMYGRVGTPLEHTQIGWLWTDPTTGRQRGVRFRGYENAANTDQQFAAARIGDTAGRRGRGDVALNQTVNISVTGSSGHETARAIVDGMSRVNGDLVRNLRTAVV